MKSCMNDILSKLVIIVLMPKLSLSVTKYVQKFPRNCTLNKKNYSNLEEKWAKSQTKAQKLKLKR